MADDDHYLMYMNQCIGRVMKFVEEGRTYFMGSLMVQDAAVWNLVLIGAAARRLSEETREHHPEIDWDHINELMSEVQAHPWEYDRDKVWCCIEEKLPEIRHELRGILVSRHMK